MSLSTFLADKEVKARFRQEFPKPYFRVKVPILAEPQTKHYALVGTAFDYLMRFYLQLLNPKAIVRSWVAESAMSELEGHRVHKKAKAILKKARNNLADYHATGEISDKLLKSAISLAKLDTYYRAGFLDEDIDKAENGDVDDLRNLLAEVDPDTFTAQETCVLNPTFGDASILIGGADADLVIDDTLIDIKTTKNLKFSRDEFNQVIGYYVLHRIGGASGLSKKHEIRKLGIYFSRHGYLHTVNVDEVIDEGKFPAFVDWFKEKAATISATRNNGKTMVGMVLEGKITLSSGKSAEFKIRRGVDGDKSIWIKSKHLRKMSSGKTRTFMRNLEELFTSWGIYAGEINDDGVARIFDTCWEKE